MKSLSLANFFSQRQSASKILKIHRQLRAAAGRPVGGLYEAAEGSERNEPMGVESLRPPVGGLCEAADCDAAFSLRPHSGHLQGAALVIVLAFVVLLTGLVVAFFSRSINNQQSSTSNANQIKADLLAQSAANTITADLLQEIAAGSGTFTYATGTVSGTLYFPKANAAQPCLVASSGSAGMENVVKMSRYQVPFYSGTSYDTTAFPPPGDSSQPANQRSRAANVSSSGTSLNFRSLSVSRWNKPFLMPITSATNYAPLIASGSFTAPDWVLVARDGSNPVTWNANMKTSGTSPSSVTGRYAYVIYDEGGLLDINAAGFPNGYPDNSLATSGSTINLPLYKNSLGFADLTQIGLNSQQINQIVGWRNFASASAGSTTPLVTGSLPSLSWSGSSSLNYYGFLVSNTTGYTTVSNTTSLTNPFGTDRMFTSRQSLIRFFTQTLSLSGTSLNPLNYLTHFSRDLNQPSLAKAQSVSKSLPGYDSNAPQIQTLANGGNTYSGLDTYVNPPFPLVRVKTPFSRNDGTIAAVGEPLVKHRFALQRLAWLTYQGPSANRSQSDPDIQLLINACQIPYSYLQQGTVANIQKYFGLTWVPDTGSKLGKWVYNVHNGPTGSGTSGPILRLGLNGVSGVSDDSSGIATCQNPHEPDFFELLKASVNAGSKAKAASLNQTLTTGTVPVTDNWQALTDASLDYAIIQLGANIIAQSQVDGFGVRIAFDNGQSAPTANKEFYGVENNPYIYRARWGVLKIRNENPVATGALPPLNAPVGASGTTGYGAGQGVLVDPGVSMVMLLPEIWNPHDNGVALPATALRPAIYRIVADSTDPDSILNGGAYDQVTAFGQDTRVTGNPNNLSYAISSTTPYFSRKKGGAAPEITGGYAGYLHPLQPSNTAMIFAIPNTSLFREPTLLARANVPSGSSLRIDSSGWSTTAAPDVDYRAIETSSGVSFSGVGFTADVANPLVLSTAPATSTAYVGIPIGLFPCEWLHTTSGKTFICRSDLAGPAGKPDITLRLQYRDPTNSSNWITYDVKYVHPGSTWMHNILGSSGAGGLMQWAPTSASYTDPRTNRFGAISARLPSGLNSPFVTPYAGPGAAAYVTPNNATYAYGVSETTAVNSKEWIDQANDVLITNRPTSDGGWSFAPNGTNAVAYPAVGWQAPEMLLGLLSQNSMSYKNNKNKYSGSFTTGTNSGSSSAYFYQDSDNVVRRAMGAYIANGSTTTTGLPLASMSYPGPASGPANQSQSRPWFLHRPFRTVAELGYVFSGTPWKNIDFFTPESGEAGMLDVFCINEENDSRALVAGKVNLNTKQQPVLRAILANSYRDEQSSNSTSTSSPVLTGGIGGAADLVANALIKRTASTTGSGGKLSNLSELIGKWVGSSNAAPIDGSTAYDGFCKDLPPLYTGISGLGGANSFMTNIQRFAEATVRPLSNVGTTRVWNLMIDVVAQTGRYPASANGLSQFIVEGEQRYWVHLSIDRFTGEVLDKQIEIVKE